MISGTSGLSGKSTKSDSRAYGLFNLHLEQFFSYPAFNIIRRDRSQFLKHYFLALFSAISIIPIGQRMRLVSYETFFTLQSVLRRLIGLIIGSQYRIRYVKNMMISMHAICSTVAKCCSNLIGFLFI